MKNQLYLHPQTDFLMYQCHHYIFKHWYLGTHYIISWFIIISFYESPSGLPSYHFMSRIQLIITSVYESLTNHHLIDIWIKQVTRCINSWVKSVTRGITFTANQSWLSSKLIRDRHGYYSWLYQKSTATYARSHIRISEIKRAPPVSGGLSFSLNMSCWDFIFTNLWVSRGLCSFMSSAYSRGIALCGKIILVILALSQKYLCTMRPKY